MLHFEIYEVNDVKVEKEVLALLQILDVCYTILVTRKVMVLRLSCINNHIALAGKVWRLPDSSD